MKKPVISLKHLLLSSTAMTPVKDMKGDLEKSYQSVSKVVKNIEDSIGKSINYPYAVVNYD